MSELCCEVNETKAEKVFICCRCGDKHRLFPGIDKPLYYCGDNICELKVGDDVEIDNGS